MTRFNPNNKGHRKTLATRISKMLVSSGFSADASHKGEVVYERAVIGTSARVRVLTSIVGGEVRQRGKDAIRICAVVDVAGETKGLVKSTRVNRTGDMGGITNRLLTAMRKTYKVAQTRAKNQSFLSGLTAAATPASAKKAASKPASAARLNAAVKKSAIANIGDWSTSLTPIIKFPSVISNFKVGALVKFTASDMAIENMSRTSRAKQVEFRDCIGVITEPLRGDGTEYQVRFCWVTGPHAGSRATLTPHMRRLWVVSVIAPGR